MSRVDLSLLLAVAACLSATAAFALDQQDTERIKVYEYDYLDLQGPNAKSVLAHAAATAAFCDALTGSDNGAKAILLRLAQPLADPQPAITAAVQAKGASGFFGDSTGFVPLEPLADIARIKNESEQAFCERYTAHMKYQAARYASKCSLEENKQHYTCPTN